MEVPKKISFLGVGVFTVITEEVLKSVEEEKKQLVPPYPSAIVQHARNLSANYSKDTGNLLRDTFRVLVLHYARFDSMKGNEGANVKTDVKKKEDGRYSDIKRELYKEPEVEEAAIEMINNFSNITNDYRSNNDEDSNKIIESKIDDISVLLGLSNANPNLENNLRIFFKIVIGLGMKFMTQKTFNENDVSKMKKIVKLLDDTLVKNIPTLQIDDVRSLRKEMESKLKEKEEEEKEEELIKRGQGQQERDRLEKEQQRQREQQELERNKFQVIIMPPLFPQISKEYIHLSEWDVQHVRADFTDKNIIIEGGTRLSVNAVIVNMFTEIKKLCAENRRILVENRVYTLHYENCSFKKSDLTSRFFDIVLKSLKDTNNGLRKILLFPLPFPEESSSEKNEFLHNIFKLLVSIPLLKKESLASDDKHLLSISTNDYDTLKQHNICSIIPIFCQIHYTEDPTRGLRQINEEQVKNMKKFFNLKTFGVTNKEVYAFITRANYDEHDLFDQYIHNSNIRKMLSTFFWMNNETGFVVTQQEYEFDHYGTSSIEDSKEYIYRTIERVIMLFSGQMKFDPYDIKLIDDQPLINPPTNVENEVTGNSDNNNPSTIQVTPKKTNKIPIMSNADISTNSNNQTDTLIEEEKEKIENDLEEQELIKKMEDIEKIDVDKKRQSFESFFRPSHFSQHEDIKLRNTQLKKERKGYTNQIESEKIIYNQTSLKIKNINKESRTPENILLLAQLGKQLVESTEKLKGLAESLKKVNKEILENSAKSADLDQLEEERVKSASRVNGRFKRNGWHNFD